MGFLFIRMRGDVYKRQTFKSLWQEMKDKIKGFGYDEVLAYDLENLKVIQKATEEALAGN